MAYLSPENLYYPSKSIIMAYNYLEKVTPLDFDCGILCGHKCCKGDSRTGMLLFPYEKELLKDVKDFHVITKNDSTYLVCNGKCDRTFRPLACRMYPLFPLVYEEGEHLRFKIIRDPRAMDCPIVMNHLKISRVFIKAISMATRYLLNDESTKNHLIALSEEILDVIKLNEYLKSNI